MGVAAMLACRAPAGLPKVLPQLAPYRPGDSTLDVQASDLQLQSLRADPESVEGQAARDRVIETVFGADDPNAMLTVILAERQRLEERAIRGLSREERHAAENIHRILIGVGTPFALATIPPKAITVAEIDPLLAWGVLRLETDERARAERLATLRDAVEGAIRHDLPAGIASLLADLQTAVSPPPQRPLLVAIDDLRFVDGVEFGAVPAASITQQLAIAVNQFSGLRTVESGAALLGNRPTHILRPTAAPDSLMLDLIAADTRLLQWRGIWPWQSADNPAADSEVSADNAASARLRALASAMAMQLAPANAVAVGDRPLEAPRFRVWVDAFFARPELSDWASALRRQLIAEMAARPEFVLIVPGAVPSAPEVRGLPLLRLRATVIGRWQRGDVTGTVGFTLANYSRLDLPIWAVPAWPIRPPTAPSFEIRSP